MALKVSTSLTDDVISCYNKHYVCDNCHKVIRFKSRLLRHVKGCLRTKCRWCNRKFLQDELSKHMRLVHPDKTNHDLNERVEICDVCGIRFANNQLFRYHLRQNHFNLKSKTPYCEKKKVNQIWFENVINCQNVVEIKKRSRNCLVIRRLDENTAIKVSELPTDDLDLTTEYPTPSKHKKMMCKFCDVELPKKKMVSHIKKHHVSCCYCNEPFANYEALLEHIRKKQDENLGGCDTGPLRLSQIECIGVT